ncbi:MAG: prepilin-type N-terminal cleavage/methylation domain-containing protein [Verrucomicrobiota bacterium]
MKRKSGMTLLELTVVILVLLSLISILFIGARAWKKGSDRSANILNIRNAQQAVRGHENLRPDQAPTEDIIYGVADDGIGGYLRKPQPPNADIESYEGGSAVPAPGELWLTANYINSGSEDYAPSDELTADW